MTNNSPNGSFPSSIDYDLHGLAGIRVLDATAKDIDTITRQLGRIQAPSIATRISVHPLCRSPGNLISFTLPGRR